MSPWEPVLTPELLDQIWRDEIRDDLFGRAAASSTPELISLGGVPAAGKTRAGVVLAAASREKITSIIGDDFRVFHPQFDEVLDTAPLEMPDVTAQAAGEWTRRSVEHALTHRHSALVEGTWRNPAVALGTARQARAHGFRVHAVALVVNPVLSRLGTMERYYGAVAAGKPARWTPPTINDEVVANFPNSARRIAVSSDVDQVSVLNRDDEIVFTSHGGDLEKRAAQCAAAVHGALSKPLTRDESQSWIQQLERLHGLHLEHTRDHPSAVAAWHRLMEVDRPLVEGYQALGIAHTTFREPRSVRVPPGELKRRPTVAVGRQQPPHGIGR